MVYLKIEKDQRRDSILLNKIQMCLQEFLEYTDEQALIATNYASKKGSCLIFEGNRSEVSELTTILAKNNIAAEIKAKEK